MAQRALILLAAAAMIAPVGCARTWDVVSSRKFREAPFSTLFSSEEPIAVLRNKVDGNERADAMRRLKEPAKQGKGQAEQDESLNILYTAATSDPSPIVRVAAIDALGRFDDPRTVTLLKEAYAKADGVPSDPARAEKNDLQQAAALDPILMLAPTGFEPSFVATLRSRTVAAMAGKGSPEAVAFLAQVATSEPTGTDAQLDRDVRSAAVRGLGKMRSKDSVAALATVLKQEAGRDVVLAQNAHEGLKELTGQDLPADPEKWQAVVQAGLKVEEKPVGLIRQMGWK
ncbi:MAG: HEAT repeat domain-containing protein [Fimbriiglobus sp.]|nr:HEAT repeat domain-containing protein [Fimbriiglobus sp.]